MNANNRVLIKPNQTLYMPHKSGSTTSPPPVRVLIETCLEAGAKPVWVAEAGGHAQKGRKVMTKTGMVHGVKQTKAHVIYLHKIANCVFEFGENAGYKYHPEVMFVPGSPVPRS